MVPVVCLSIVLVAMAFSVWAGIKVKKHVQD